MSESESKFHEIAKQLISRAGVIRVQNAMNPTLWACLIVAPISWIAAYFMKDTLAFLLLIIVGMIPIIMWFLQTAYFSIRDPKLLQSEEFQLRQQALNMIERKGEGIVSDPERIVEMTEIQFEIERSEIEHSSEKKDA